MLIRIELWYHKLFVKWFHLVGILLAIIAAAAMVGSWDTSLHTLTGENFFFFKIYIFNILRREIVEAKHYTYFIKSSIYLAFE